MKEEKTHTKRVKCFVWYSGLGKTEQANSIMSLPVIGEPLDMFALYCSMNARRQIGQRCFRLPSFQFPCNTRRRRVAKNGEGNIR